MQYQNIHYRKTIMALLATFILACLGSAPVAQASNKHSIVGMWSVHYVSTTGGPEVFSYDQWHADGLEFEAANLAPGALCQGTYKQAPDGSYHNYHAAWTFDSTGAPSGYWDENMVITLSADGQSYSGTFAQDFYDVDGNFLFENDGTMTATRVNVER